MGNKIEKGAASIKRKITGNSSNPPPAQSAQSAQNQFIAYAMNCPNCTLFFPKGTPYTIVKTHFADCVQKSLSSQINNDQDWEDEEEIEVPIPKTKPFIQNHSSKMVDNFFLPGLVDNYFYEKLPADVSLTKFKWTKTELKPAHQNLLNLSPQLIKSCSFQDKSNWFRFNLERFRIPWMSGADFMRIQKSNVLMSSLVEAQKVNMYKEVKIEFAGDKVSDAGGLLREWIHMVIKEIFDESTGIFGVCNAEDIMYKLKWDEEIDEQFSSQLMVLFGIIIGKALFQKIPILSYLDRTLLRQLSSKNEVKLQDIYGYDKELYQSWKFLLENEIDEMGLETYFVLTKPNGESETINFLELVEGGKEILVTDANKKMYVDLCIEIMCKERVERSINSIRKGLHKVIPEQLIEIFEPFELQMLLYGVPFINLKDWIDNTDYKGLYHPGHQVIRWFWEVVKQFDQEKLARLLQFSTGSSRTPIHGFKKLQSNRGNFGKFLIQSSDFSKKNPFPKGHTCFNRLELPCYPNKEVLRTHVLAVVTNNLDGVFGLD